MQDKRKLGSMLEKSEIQCLRESCKREAMTDQSRPMPDHWQRRVSRPSGRAGIEQVQGRARTAARTEPRHGTGTFQAHFLGQR